MISCKSSYVEHDENLLLINTVVLNTSRYEQPTHYEATNYHADLFTVSGSHC